MIAALLLSALAHSPLVNLPAASDAPSLPALDDAVETPSALDGWAFLVRLCERFAADPYALETHGKLGTLPRPWVGSPLAEGRDLPPPPAGAQGFAVQRLALSCGLAADARILDVELDLVLHAKDAVAGAQLLEHVLAHLAAQPEVSDLTRPATEPLAEGGGLLAEGLRLRLELTRRPAQRSRSAESFTSRELALRTLATRDGSRVPGLRFAPDSAGGAELRQVDGASVSADDLHGLLARLEDARPDVKVTALELRRTQAEATSTPRAPWAWVARVDRVEATPEAGPAPQSGLAALQVFYEVLHGLQDAGVDLDGFVPEVLYGQAEPIELDLDEARSAFLSRSEGLGIAVRALSAAHEYAKPDSQGERIVLSVDLALHGPDLAAAARLYEELCQVLEMRLEVEGLSEAQLIARVGEGAVAEVKGLRIELVVEPRPIASFGRDESGAMSFLARTAADRNVRIGMVEITPSERQVSPVRSDRIFRVRPSQKGEVFSTPQIYNFIWLLEANTRVLTLTRLRVRPAAQEGRWTFDLAVTEPREK